MVFFLVVTKVQSTYERDLQNTFHISATSSVHSSSWNVNAALKKGQRDMVRKVIRSSSQKKTSKKKKKERMSNLICIELSRTENSANLRYCM